jgi:hypothetical protein
MNNQESKGNEGLGHSWLQRMVLYGQDSFGVLQLPVMAEGCLNVLPIPWHPDAPLS